MSDEPQNTESKAGTRAADPQVETAGQAAFAGGDLTGQLLSGRYKILERVGAGAMGSVYRAEHTLMKKIVAIKVLHAEQNERNEIITRFQRAAQAAAHIDHPNVCTATDFGEAADGSFFLVMEYLEGRTLKELITAEGRLDANHAVTLMIQVVSALQRAHGLGVVHRDLKPENIFLTRRGFDDEFVKIVDFGIARVQLEGDDSVQLTQAGKVYGTPQYLSPEQAVGEEIDARSDLYAVGVVLFEMLTGQPPFTGSSVVQLIGKHVTQKPPSFASIAPDLEVDEGLQAVVFKLLEKQPRDRFQNATELLEAFFELGYSGPSGVLNSSSNIVPVGPRVPRPSIEHPAASNDQLSSDVSSTGLKAPAHKKPAHKVPLIAVGVVGVLLLLLVAIVWVASTGPNEKEVAAAGEQATEPRLMEQVQAGPATLSPVETANSGLSPALDQALEVALGGGDGAHEATQMIRGLESEFSENAEYWLVRGQAIQAQKRTEGDAVKSLEKALELAPALIGERKAALLLATIYAQRKDKSAAERAYALIVAQPEDAVLAALAEVGRSGPLRKDKRERERAVGLLKELGRYDDLERWERLCIELREQDSGGCRKRRPVVEAIAEEGDPRALPTVLILHESGRTGCGSLFEDGDCQDCMRDLLEETVSKLRAKAKVNSVFD